MGYLALGEDYFSLSEEGRSSEYYGKAFQLRERTSEREKQAITAEYYSSVTGELDKAAQAYQEQIRTYPREYRAYHARDILELFAPVLTPDPAPSPPIIEGGPVVAVEGACDGD